MELIWNNHTLLTVVLAVTIGIVSVARTARLLIFDEYPPVEWVRMRFLALFDDDSPWRKLAECPFCLAPYLTVGMVGWAYLSDLHWTWWLINGAWAGSYLAAIIVAYDQPED